MRKVDIHAVNKYMKTRRTIRGLPTGSVQEPHRNATRCHVRMSHICFIPLGDSNVQQVTELHLFGPVPVRCDSLPPFPVPSCHLFSCPCPTASGLTLSSTITAVPICLRSGRLTSNTSRPGTVRAASSTMPSISRFHQHPHILK